MEDVGSDGSEGLLDENFSNDVESVCRAVGEHSEKQQRPPVTPGPISRMDLNDNKAGMDGIDKERINQIIHEASKGSKFYQNEIKKEQITKQRVAKLKMQLANCTANDKEMGLEQMDKLVNSLEAQRDFSRLMVHVDMDAFYAAVEMRDDPSLVDIPMGVGGNSMLSTSNYPARRYGVRAGMPGYIAKKLCPHLKIVPSDFAKYTAVSKVVRNVMEQYDQNMCTMSLDEAYLDLTDHVSARESYPEKQRTYFEWKCTCHGDKNEYQLTDLVETKFSENGMPVCSVCGQLSTDKKAFGLSVDEAVAEMRFRITQQTRLTASAGIASNTMLAKVCSDMNKPNGQFKVIADRDSVMEFVNPLPIRKISGIGKVTEQILKAFDIQTCGDIFDKRCILPLIFSKISVNFFLRVSLGIGSTNVEHDSERKSISLERTFRDTSDVHVLNKFCRDLCENLAEAMQEEGLCAKTICIKLKADTFSTKTKAHTLNWHVASALDMYKVASDLLKAEIEAAKPEKLTLRLFGVRASQLRNSSSCSPLKQTDITKLVQSMKQNAPCTSSTSRETAVDRSTDTSLKEPDFASVGSVLRLVCPVCNSLQTVASLDTFNLHIDSCLNRQTASELLREDVGAKRGVSSAYPKKRPAGNKPGPPSGKRVNLSASKPKSSTLLQYFSYDEKT